MTSVKIPAEWIQRIFTRFEEIWGDKFLASFRSPQAFDLELVRWQSGLIGCTPTEIKSVIEMCVAGTIRTPPNVIEFFHYCKGNKQPAPLKPKPQENITPEIGKAYLDLIRDKLHGRLTSEGKATLSALDKQVLENVTQKETQSTVFVPNIKPFDGEAKPHWQDD